MHVDDTVQNVMFPRYLIFKWGPAGLRYCEVWYVDIDDLEEYIPVIKGVNCPESLEETMSQPRKQKYSKLYLREYTTI
jgi:hypothetical protein